MAFNQTPAYEHLDIHIPNNFLLSGERLFLSLYCLQKGTNQLSYLSKVAYIEIIDENFQPILQQKISLEKGRGSADFFISSSIPSGSYKVVAYTEWMKNGGVNNFYQSDLFVVNPFVPWLRTGSSINDSSSEKSQLTNKEPKPIHSYQITIKKDNSKIFFEIENPSPESNSESFLLIHNEGRLKNFLRFRAYESNISLSIPRKELPSGQLIASVIDLHGKLKGEGFFYLQPQQKDTIEILLDKEVFKPRDKVSIELFGFSNLSTLSISVQKHESQHDITDDFSKLNLYTNRISLSDTSQRDDNSLSKELFPNYSWDSIDPQPISYLPEYRKDLVIGQAQSSINGEWLKNHPVELSSLNHFYQAKTDDWGFFYFELNDYSSSGNYNIRIPGQSVGDYKIQIFDDFYSNYHGGNIQFSPFCLDSLDRGLIERRSLQVQLENAFLEAKIDSLIRNIKQPFYGEPLVTYYLDEYTRFAKMEDVLREYIPQIAVRKDKEKYSFRLVEVSESVFLPPNPLIIVDGLPVSDPNIIIGLDPLKIERIEIINRRYHYGIYTFNGIISLFSYKGELKLLGLDQDLHTFNVQGLSPKKQYYHPNYSSGNKLGRIPDFRNQLYWNPIFTVNQYASPHIDFYTSDVTGFFDIDIRGLDEFGNVLILRERFEVSRPP